MGLNLHFLSKNLYYEKKKFVLRYYMIYGWLNRHMKNCGLGGPAITLHTTFQSCGGLAPQPLCCSGINCIIHFFGFFFKFIYFSWWLITLQYCSGFCHTLIWIDHGFTCVPHPEPPSLLHPHPIPLGHPSASVLSTLSHASNLDWRSISHMIMYMFQCYSLRSFHPRFLPQSPKDCSIHLCLFCCLTYGIIINHLSKFHIYALVYCIGVFFLAYFTLYIFLAFLCIVESL